MEDSAKPERDAPHSLAPVALEKAQIDEDIALLKRGKGARLMLTVAICGLAVFGVARWMQTIDGAQAYAGAADRVDTINAQEGTALMRCVLPDVSRSQISTRQALHSALENASERAQKYYGTQLQRCAPLSETLEKQLNMVGVPADLQPQMQRLRGAARDLNRSLIAYQTYLQDPNKPYDYVQATPLIERVSIAWSNYEDQRTQTSRALREHP